MTLHEPAANLPREADTVVGNLAKQVRDRLALIATNPANERPRQADLLARQLFRQLIPDFDAIQSALRDAGYSDATIAEFRIPRTVASARTLLPRLESLLAAIREAHREPEE